MSEDAVSDLRRDRLYDLLPVHNRMQDHAQGEPLKALLAVIAEQVNVVEDDIARLYESWFIETCEDWVVPYIGDLVGYEPVAEARLVARGDSPQEALRNKFLLPRREVANTVRYRRRKGTIALLELLARDVADWPARAVEFYQLLGVAQHVNHLSHDRGRTLDLRDMGALSRIGTPFDTTAHVVDVRRIASRHTLGRHNIPSVGLFVWRLGTYSINKAPAYCVEATGPQCYTLSVLGNDAPLFVDSQAEDDPTRIAEELNLPVPISRHLFVERKSELYGEDRSLQVWVGRRLPESGDTVAEPIPAQQIVPADLSDWERYQPRPGTVALDVQLGRIAFPTRQPPREGVWVSYHYGFSAAMAGGEYERELAQVEGATIYQVGEFATYRTIGAALDAWAAAADEHAVIEVADSGVYVEPVNIEFAEGQKTLQLRAANRRRPVIRLLDWQTDRPDSLAVRGVADACFILDGMLVTGRGVQVSGELAELTIRHTTLVPGWTLDCDCEPQRANEPSLEITAPRVCVKIEHSILGTIQINPIVPGGDGGETGRGDVPEEELLAARCQGIGPGFRLDRLRVCISDSILDATDPDLEALGAPSCPVAHACVTVVRSTVIGQIQAHSIELAENSIFLGRITVARRQIGCLRFSYVAPGSRTPARYRCQPDLVEQAAIAELRDAANVQNLPSPSEAEIDAAVRAARLAVRPQLVSWRYGLPGYCQLALCGPEDIARGSDDEAEMGVFHNLFQPQRAAALEVRLNEFIPASHDVGIMFAS